MSLRVHVVEHVPFEGPAEIGRWALARGAEVVTTRVYAGESFPGVGAFDVLVLMGGPMSVTDEAALPWLVSEKRLVRESISAGRSVLGVCLGAQMIASALGSAIYRAREKEIGWFPARRVVGSETPFGRIFPSDFTPFHWHGETFDLPPGSTLLASTEAVPHQAFAIGSRVVGMQFHLEVTPGSVDLLIEHCAGDIAPGGRYQQSPVEIREKTPAASRAVHPILHALLDELAG
jgi:GMP synthase-like glutamine amidotransferase